LACFRANTGLFPYRFLQSKGMIIRSESEQTLDGYFLLMR
jgi:hypothetical protein